MPAAKQWNLSAGVDFIWREWTGEKVAYEKFSGDLHLFDPVTSSVLEVLSGQGMDEQALISKVAENFEIDASQELGSVVLDSLNKLFTLHLVDCAS